MVGSSLMATDSASGTATSLDNQFLTFVSDGEVYALDISVVREIRVWSEVRGLPEMPGYLRGVLNLRGTFVPVMDLRLRFGRPETAYGPTTVIIVLGIPGEQGERLLGVVADGVSDVMHVDSEAVSTPPRVAGTGAEGFVQGLVQQDDTTIVVLDPLLLADQQVLEMDMETGAS